MEKLINEINNVLKNQYNIIATKIEKSEESTAGNVYIIYGNKNKYVVKIYDDIKHAERMCNLHLSLLASNIYVPCVISSLKNEKCLGIYNNKYIVVYSFLEGNQLEFTKEYNEDIISLIAKTLRKMHDITSGENRFNFNNVPFNIDINRNSVLHFDLTKSNIFVNSNNQIGFIDFDDAKYGASVCDVAIAIALLFFTKKNGADTKGASKFINEYYGKDIELRNNEVIKIKECAIQWIDFTLKNNEFEPSTKDSFEIKKKLIENINTIL